MKKSAPYQFIGEAIRLNSFIYTDVLILSKVVMKISTMIFWDNFHFKKGENW